MDLQNKTNTSEWDDDDNNIYINDCFYKDGVKYKVVCALLDNDAVICVALNTQNDQHQTKQFTTSDGTILAAIQRYTS